MAVRGQRGSADGGRASGLPGGPGREAETCQLPTWDGPATSYLRHSFSLRRSRQGRRQRGSLLSWKRVKEITTVSQTIYKHRAHRKRTKDPSVRQDAQPQLYIVRSANSDHDKMAWWTLKQSNAELPHDPAISLLRIHLKELKAGV